MIRKVCGLGLLTLYALATSVDAAPVAVTLVSHNVRGQDGTLATLLWKPCPGPTYAIGSGCVNPANAWFVANGVTASTATWTWDNATGILASSGVFSTTTSSTSNPNSAAIYIIINSRVVDLVLNTTAGTTSATSYNCVEGGTYALAFNSNACLGLPADGLGANFTLDSSAVYNVGGNANCINETIAGDDLGPAYPVGLFTAVAGGGCNEVQGAFDLWTVVTNSGGSLVISNGIPLTDPGTQYLTFASPITAVSLNLTSGASGTNFLNQSFNGETRTAQVTVLGGANLVVSSMTLNLFDIKAGTATMGARIYDATTQALVASADITPTVADNQSVTIPIAATLIAGQSYRLGFFIGNGPGNAADMFDPTPASYTETNGLLQITGAHSIIADAFPTGSNIFIPLNMGIEVSAAGALDTDGDGVADAVDNCPGVANANQADTDGDLRGNMCDNCRLLANNGTGNDGLAVHGAQADSDHDGFGNRCDADFNNSGSTNAFDTPLFRAQFGFFTVPPIYNVADLNTSGSVNAFDTPLYRALLGLAPGPGAGP